MNAYNQYHYQFDIYLRCHAIPAIANKNIYGYILRNTENHPMEGIDMSSEDNEVGPKPQHENLSAGHRNELAYSYLHFCIFRGIYFDMNT